MEKSYRAIAYELNTTEGTIKLYVDRIKKRLGVRSIVGIALWWERRERIVTINGPWSKPIILLTLLSAFIAAQQIGGGIGGSSQTAKPPDPQHHHNSQ